MHRDFLVSQPGACHRQQSSLLLDPKTLLWKGFLLLSRDGIIEIKRPFASFKVFSDLTTKLFN